MASNSKKLYCSNYSSSLPFTLSVSFSETSYSVANNTSTLSFSASIKSGGVAFDTNYNNTLVIKWYDNNAYVSGKTIATLNVQDLSKNATESVSGSLTVTHLADGSLSGYAQAVWTRHSSNASVGYVPASGNVSTSNTALTTIPRASSFTLSGSALGSPVTVTISRASTSFTHKVEWKFGNSDYVTATTSATTSATFTPSTSYASQYPNSTSGTLTVRVTTYNGSTQIGSSSTKTLTLTTTTSGSVPTCSNISFLMVNNQIPLSWGVYVQGYSQVIASISGTGVDGSTITGYYISGAGKTVNSDTLTSDVLKNSGEYQFTAYVTDSRGNKSVEKKSSIVVQPYYQPSISVTAKRCTSDGTIDSSGTYINVVCEYDYASVNGNNTITRSVSCNGSSNTTFENGTSFILDANCSISSTYTVTAKIEDALGNSATATYLLSTAERIMNVKQNGKGVAFGGFANEDEVLQSYWDIRVKDKNVSLEGHTHTKSQITDFPTSLKNPNALTISLNGTSQGAYDGSSAKSINITPSGIGASASSHTHSTYSPIGASTSNGGLVKLWSGAATTASFSISDNYKFYLVRPGTSSGYYFTWIVVPYITASSTTAFRGIGGYETSSSSNGGEIEFLRGTVSDGVATIEACYMRKTATMTTNSSATQLYIREVWGVK